MDDFPRIRLKQRSGKLRLLYGGYVRNRWQVSYRDKEVWLSDTLASILLCLMMNRNVVTEEKMVEAVWEDPDRMPDYFMDVLKVHRSRLNKILRRLGWCVKPYRDHMFTLAPYKKPRSCWDDERTMALE